MAEKRKTRKELTKEWQDSKTTFKICLLLGLLMVVLGIATCIFTTINYNAYKGSDDVRKVKCTITKCERYMQKSNGKEGWYIYYTYEIDGKKYNAYYKNDKYERIGSTFISTKYKDKNGKYQTVDVQSNGGRVVLSVIFGIIAVLGVAMMGVGLFYGKKSKVLEADLAQVEQERKEEKARQKALREEIERQKKLEE